MLALAFNTPVAFVPPAAPRAPQVRMQATETVDDLVGLGNTPKPKEFCYGLPGSISPIEEFDPFNLLDGKTEEEVLKWREAELAHGRVGMLAAAGFLVQEKFHPLFSGDGGPAIEQIPKLPVFMWFAMTLGIGVVEGYRVSVGWASPNDPGHTFQKLKPGYIPGDLGFDPLGLRPTDPAEFREMQTKELQNGRLGMIAAAGFMAQEAASGSTWGTYWVPEFGEAAASF